MQWRENWWKCCCTCTCLVGRHSMKAEEKQIKFQAQNALPGCLPSKGEGLKMVKSTPATILVGEVPGKSSWRYANRNPVQFLDVGASQGGCSGKKKKNVEEKLLPKKLRPGVAREHLLNTFYCMNEEWLLRSWQFKVRFCSQDDACTTLFIFIESIN